MFWFHQKSFTTIYVWAVMNAYNRVDFEFPVAIRASLPSATTCLERPYLLDPLGGRYIQVLLYMERHGHFNPSQHGFRVGRSCLSQLIAHYDCILESLENGSNVDVVYIDFAKAFDKVDFMMTLQKLKDLGNSTSVYNYSKYLTSSLDWNRATDWNNKPTRRK